MNATPTPCKIAVVGAGAVGCYYGGRLAQHGEDVHFHLRSDAAHVRAHGLRVQSHLGDFELPRVKAYSDTAEIGPCDLVLITLKATSNLALDHLLPPLLNDDTVLLTLQNGLGNEEYLAARWGNRRVLGGVCFTCINRLAPGVIDHIAQGAVTIAAHGRPAGERTRRIAAMFSNSGIECRADDSLAAVRWRKLVWNIPFNGLAILAGTDTGRILTDPALAFLARSLMEEIITCSQALGHPQPEWLIADQFERTRGMGTYQPSSMIDFMAGRDVEVEAIWGEPWRRAVAAGTQAARLEVMYQLIRSSVDRRASVPPRSPASAS